MHDYHMLDAGQDYDSNELVQKYNDAVETIWLLQNRLAEISKDHDNLAYAYDQISDQLYG